jgi:tetratricopeptide (TPR) repeat protein
MRPLSMLACICSLSLFCFSCGGGGEKAREAYLKGKEAYARQDLETARTRFLESLDYDRTLLNAHLMIAKIDYFQRDFGDALGRNETILERNKDHTGGLFWKARVLAVMPETSEAEMQKHEADAIECLKRTLELDSHHIHARSLLALLYEKRSLYKEAMIEYLTALEEEETLVSTRANLGILYRRMGMRDRSVKEIKTAIKIAESADINKKGLQVIMGELEK